MTVTPLPLEHEVEGALVEVLEPDEDLSQRWAFEHHRFASSDRRRQRPLELRTGEVPEREERFSDPRTRQGLEGQRLEHLPFGHQAQADQQLSESPRRIAREARRVGRRFA